MASVSQFIVMDDTHQISFKWDIVDSNLHDLLSDKISMISHDVNTKSIKIRAISK